MRGDSFRNRVADVLRARYGQADIERKVGGKNADILFLLPYPGGTPIRVAVECKDWATPLRSKHITSIFAEYTPAFEANEIDSLWIVSARSIQAEQKETARTYGIKLRVFTLEGLIDQIIDFSPYLNYLIDEFSRDNLDQYYIMPRTDDGSQLHETITIPWLTQKDSTPIAIIAEYGAGKTSYAKFLAAWLARQALADLFQPKPILLHLGNLTRQQSVRGLINSLFSDEFGIEGYSYRLFNLLLKQGAFIVILDGFDEMKHAMKSRDILANFTMIREFIDGKLSKFILLGRPDPFITIRDELAFKGGIKVGTQIVVDSTKSSFTIIGLDEFDDEELKKFFRSFLLSNYSCQAIKNKLEYINSRLHDIQKMKIMDVVSKPVHAKMLAILTASPHWKIDTTTEYDLFDHFVSEFLHRELSEKEARAPISEVERRAFMEQIAWWLWTKKRRISFTADEVPEYIIGSSRRHFELEDTKEDIIREMLIGSILSRQMSADLVVTKGDVSFYFPHKSYWEFLVAEYIASSRFKSTDMRDFLQGTTPEVLKFLRERNDRGFVDRLYRLVNNYKESFISFGFLEQFTDIFRWNSGEVGRIDTGITTVVTVAAAVSGGHAPFEYLERKLRPMFESHDAELEYAGLMLLNLIVGESKKENHDVIEYLVDKNTKLFIKIIMEVGISTLVNASVEKRRVRPKMRDFLVRIYNDGVQFDANGAKIVFYPSIIAGILKPELSRGIVQYIDFGNLSGMKTVDLKFSELIDKYAHENIRASLQKLINGKKPPLLLSYER
jgi:hypothetical protein